MFIIIYVGDLLGGFSYKFIRVVMGSTYNKSMKISKKSMKFKKKLIKVKL